MKTDKFWNPTPSVRDWITLVSVPCMPTWSARTRATVIAINDQEALNAAYELTQLEGIIPALESAHALGL